MASAKCYTPQLRRDLVSRLYRRAQAERVPMTVLANRIMEDALQEETTLRPPSADQVEPK